MSVAKEHLLDRARTDAERAKVQKYVTVHGQELQPANYAICQAVYASQGRQRSDDLLWKNP